MTDMPPVRKLDLPRTDATGASYLSGLKSDCWRYNGYKPCGVQFTCEGCTSYETWPAHIAIVKLGALGDVVRTTPLLVGLAKKYGRRLGDDAIVPPRILWVTQGEIANVLKRHPLVHEVVDVDKPAATLSLAGREPFDLVLCLDKEPEALGAAAMLPARKRMGFARSALGGMTVANAASWRLLKLGLDDVEKFRLNTMSVPEQLFEACELTYEREPYHLPLTSAGEAERAMWRERWMNGGKTRVVGINPGAGARFPTKAWPLKNVAEAARELTRDPSTRVVLLGGPGERAAHERLVGESGGALEMGPHDLPLERFHGAVWALDALITSDSLAMHLAIAGGVWTVALLGPTSATEIDVQGRGGKMVTDFSCAPCYLAKCPQERFCMAELSGEQAARLIGPRS